jgi:hypothetical protein
MDMAVERQPGFFILPFGMDGEPVGFGFWEQSKLSESWLNVCKDYLNTHGTAFDASWSGNLSHIRTKLTSASATALVTFFVQGNVALSVLLLAGTSSAVEESVSQVFVESLRRSAPVQAATHSPNPFNDIFSAKDRPLMVVVPWPDATVSEEDHKLVRELGLHLAGAFFSEQA